MNDFDYLMKLLAMTGPNVTPGAAGIDDPTSAFMEIDSSGSVVPEAEKEAQSPKEDAGKTAAEKAKEDYKEHWRRERLKKQIEEVGKQAGNAFSRESTPFSNSVGGRYAPGSNSSVRISNLFAAHPIQRRFG